MMDAINCRNMQVAMNERIDKLESRTRVLLREMRSDLDTVDVRNRVHRDREIALCVSVLDGIDDEIARGDFDGYDRARIELIEKIDELRRTYNGLYNPPPLRRYDADRRELIESPEWYIDRIGSRRRESDDVLADPAPSSSVGGGEEVQREVNIESSSSSVVSEENIPLPDLSFLIVPKEAVRETLPNLGTCAICMSDITVIARNEVMKTQCDHVFHSACLLTWARCQWFNGSSSRINCPYCRTVIATSSSVL